MQYNGFNAKLKISVLRLYRVKEYIMTIKMKCLGGMVDRQKIFSLIFSQDHCQGSSSSRISDTPWAGFEPAQNLSSGIVEWSWAVVYKGVDELKGRNSAYYSHEINILDFELWLRPWNYISTATQVKQSPAKFFRNYAWYLETKSHKIWEQSIAPFQNSRQFKLPRINLDLLGSNSVKATKVILYFKHWWRGNLFYGNSFWNGFKKKQNSYD